MLLDICTKCVLHTTRYSRVEGQGSAPADILFIGDPPDLTDDLVGKYCLGNVFDLALKKSGLDKYRIFITGYLHCRPTDHKKSKSRIPNDFEIVACFDNIRQLIKIVQPKQIVFLGNDAARVLRKLAPRAITIPHPRAVGHLSTSLGINMLNKLRLISFNFSGANSVSDFDSRFLRH